MSEESEWVSSWYSLSSAKLSSYVSSIDPSPRRMIGSRLSLESELRGGGGGWGAGDIPQTQNKPQKTYVKDTHRGCQQTSRDNKDKKKKKSRSKRLAKRS